MHFSLAKIYFAQSHARGLGIRRCLDCLRRALVGLLDFLLLQIATRHAGVGFCEIRVLLENCSIFCRSIVEPASAVVAQGIAEYRFLVLHRISSHRDSRWLRAFKLDWGLGLFL